jgi:hypothetical protein
MDAALMPRFKNPIPLDELRLKKKIRGSEPTLGNSLPQNIVESRYVNIFCGFNQQ